MSTRFIYSNNRCFKQGRDNDEIFYSVFYIIFYSGGKTSCFWNCWRGEIRKCCKDTTEGSCSGGRHLASIISSVIGLGRRIRFFDGILGGIFGRGDVRSY